MSGTNELRDATVAPTAPTATATGVEPQADRSYEVGYGKPPRNTQFKKGQSGNPRRQRKPKSAVETAAFLLERPVTITENGKRRRVTMQEALMMSQMKKAIAGDNKAAKMLLEMGAKAPPPPPELTSEENEEVMKEAMQGFNVEELMTIATFTRQLGVAVARIKAQKM